MHIHNGTNSECPKLLMKQRAQYRKITALKIKIKILNYYIKGKNITFRPKTVENHSFCKSVNIKL